MKPRQAFDAEREEAAALPRPARRDPALAMAKRQVLVLLGAWLAVRALLMPAALLAERGFLDQRSGGARRQCSGSRVYSFRHACACGACHARHGGVGCADGARTAGIFFLRRRSGSLCGAVSGRAGSTAGTIGLSVFPARCEAIFQCVRAERKKR